MKIAVVGAGLAGVATCWHLLHFPSTSVTLFDPHGIAGGASGLSAGLLYAYPGCHARPTWQAAAGRAATLELLQVAEKEYGRPLTFSRGILRPAVTEKQKIAFMACANKHTDTEWWEAAQAQQEILGLTKVPALAIRSGISLQVPEYLKGLWQACEKKGALLCQERLSSLQELDSFDQIVVAAGGATSTFPELRHLPIKMVKGQLLELEWPKELGELPWSLVSHAYVVKVPGSTTCILGATFERAFQDALPDPKTAEKELRAKVAEFFPALQNAPLVACRSGLRVVSPDNITPIVGRLPSSNIWIFTGLGSKGLLHHSWLSQKLAEALLSDNPLLLPHKVRFRLKQNDYQISTDKSFSRENLPFRKKPWSYPKKNKSSL